MAAPLVANSCRATTISSHGLQASKVARRDTVHSGLFLFYYFYLDTRIYFGHISISISISIRSLCYRLSVCCSRQ
jgi:hypothetical protein